MKKFLIALLITLTAVGTAWADCPLVVRRGMKDTPDIHPGQWYTVSYPHGLCGPSEITATWTAAPSGRCVQTDLCYNAADYFAHQTAGIKKCNRDNGKVFWVGTSGIYNVTACAPDGSCATLFREVVD